MLLSTTSWRRRAASLVLALTAVASTFGLATTAPAQASPTCTASFAASTIYPNQTVGQDITGPDGTYAMWYSVDGGSVNPYTDSYTVPAHENWNYGWVTSGLGATQSLTVLIYPYGTTPGTVGETAPLCQDTLLIGTVVEPTAQAITFSPVVTHDLTWFMVTGTADSGLDVAFSSLTPAVCDVTTTGGVTPLAAGTCTIAADQAGDATYAAATRVTRDITIEPYTQVVTFAPIADRVLGSGPVPLVASSTMDLVVDFVSETPAVCTISGTNAVLVSPGTCTIIASQPGVPGTIESADATRSFVVRAAAVLPQAVLALDVPRGLPLSAGVAPVKVSSTGTAPVALRSKNGDVCKVTAQGEVRLVDAGTCRLTATQGADTGHRAPDAAAASFQVWAPKPLPATAKATEVLAVLGQGEDGYRVVATPAAVCRVSDGEVVLVAAGTCRIEVRTAGATVRSAKVDVVVPARPTTKDDSLDLGATVYFTFNSSELSGAGRATLRKVAPKLRKADLVVVYGHTFGPGKNSRSSKQLAADRAGAVVAYLTTLDIDAKAVSEVALAMQQPVSSVPAKNRRAEIYFR